MIRSKVVEGNHFLLATASGYSHNYSWSDIYVYIMYINNKMLSDDCKQVRLWQLKCSDLHLEDWG